MMSHKCREGVGTPPLAPAAEQSSDGATAWTLDAFVRRPGQRRAGTQSSYLSRHWGANPWWVERGRATFGRHARIARSDCCVDLGRNLVWSRRVLERWHVDDERKRRRGRRGQGDVGR